METLKLQAEQKGYTYFDWNVDSADSIGGSDSPSTIYERVINQAKDKNSCVVLMHDTVKTENTAKALPDIIEWFKNSGYRFDTLDNKI